jgi:hypothetical protein
MVGFKQARETVAQASKSVTAAAADTKRSLLAIGITAAAALVVGLFALALVLGGRRTAAAQ